MPVLWTQTFEYKHFLFFFLENDISFAKYRRDWRALKLTNCLWRIFLILSSGRRWGRSGWWRVVCVFPCFATFFSPQITYSCWSMWSLCYARISMHLSLVFSASKNEMLHDSFWYNSKFFLSLNKQKLFSVNLHLSHFFIQNIISGTKSLTFAPFIFYIFYCYFILMLTSHSEESITAV